MFSFIDCMVTPQFYAASDTRDASLWVDAFFTDDAAIDFGNHPTVRGKENIRPVSLPYHSYHSFEADLVNLRLSGWANSSHTYH